MARDVVGRLGENFARKYLLELGYEIITQNFFARGGELDLVARDGRELVFIEVKSLLKHSGISIFETLTPRKLKKIARTINCWLLQNNALEQTWRFDFIGVILHSDLSLREIEHVKNAEI